MALGETGLEDMRWKLVLDEMAVVSAAGVMGRKLLLGDGMRLRRRAGISCVELVGWLLASSHSGERS